MFHIQINYLNVIYILYNKKSSTLKKIFRNLWESLLGSLIFLLKKSQRKDLSLFSSN